MSEQKTLRDEFAIAALQTMAGIPVGLPTRRRADCDKSELARLAYELADAMLKARAA